MTDAVFPVVTYLVASARDCLEGPIVYASLRMLETTRRLIDATERAGLAPDPCLVALGERLGAAPADAMTDRDRYVAWLDGVLADLADEARRRNAEAG